MSKETRRQIANLILKWLYGLVGGFIGGGATALISWLGMAAAKANGVDIPELNLKAYEIIFLSGGIMAAAAYLKQSPLPNIES
jgi:hypothetical protein